MRIVGYFILCCCVVHINSQQFDRFTLLPFPDADVQVLLDECEDHFICVIGANPNNLIVGCINKTRLCDGIQDCVSGIDERSCPLLCNFGEYKCISSTHICLPAEQLCNGISDCPDNDDESFCGTTCPGNHFTCIDGKCVHASKRCDGIMDCVDNSDEASCVNGGYTDWSAWGTCSQACGMGTQTRTRTCTNPAPQFGGLDCMGPPMEQQVCQIVPCPINGGYTDWSAWGTCSQACGMGTQTRTRTCTNPAPQFGGLDCMGPPMEQQMCQIAPCLYCPMTLPFAGGVVYPEVTDFSVGVTVDYDCTTICGYTQPSGGTIVCQADLTWSLPSCSGDVPPGSPGCVTAFGPQTCGPFTYDGRFFIGGNPTFVCACDFYCCSFGDCCYDASCPFL
ncbi:hypothetical protein ACF0H5_002603 [Mactra antiquata]